MKKRLVLTLGALLSGLWIATAMAADEGEEPAAPPPQAEEQVAAPAEGAAVEPGTVPQTQIDIFNKREEARKRRDEALKVRQQMIQGGQ